MKKILFVTTECAPFVKVGGLADVSASLPLAIRNFDIRLILPFYGCIREPYRSRFLPDASFFCVFGGHTYRVLLRKALYNGLVCYAIDSPAFFDTPDDSGPYSDALTDNRKFLFFCHALLEALPLIDYCPDIFHLNDWHTCFLPPLLRHRKSGYFCNAKTLLTIHNIGCMGIVRLPGILRESGLPLLDFAIGPFAWHFRNSNPLKAGILTADRLTTVSPSYAAQLCRNGPGNYLSRQIRKRLDDLCGIRNGIDQNVWNPQTDPLLFAPFDHHSFAAGKAVNKRKLQERFSLPCNPDSMVLAMVSRFSLQKGSELVCRAAADLLRRYPDLQLLFLGDGEDMYKEQIQNLKTAFPDRVGAFLEFSLTLPSLVYAGADALLMPSLYEPCGLSQLIAMRYGTIPIVRATGGLKDTVFSCSPDGLSGNGFLFEAYSADALTAAIESAHDMWRGQKALWNALIQRCMAFDSSWEKPAAEYEKIYRKLCGS